MSPAVKDTLRGFLRVWIVGTLMLWLPGLFGWINAVTAWAHDQGATAFPDAHGLLYLFVAAITSAFVAAGTSILRYVENLAGKSLLLRPAGPPVNTNPPPPRGYAAPNLVWVVIVVVLVLVLIALLT